LPLRKSKGRKDCIFVITQSFDDIKILQKIQQALGFGKRYTQSKTQKTARYIVQDQKNIGLLILLFNGNIVLSTRKERFLVFVSAFNQLVEKSNLRKKNVQPKAIVKPKHQSPIPTLKDAWFSGLTDSEGCFYAYGSQKHIGFRIGFSLHQKGLANKFILEHYSQLFTVGAVRSHFYAENWGKGCIEGFKSCLKLLPYFDKFSLQSKKAYAFNFCSCAKARENGKKFVKRYLKEITRLLKKEQS
jgi:LAGLIDADG endonuclease